MKAYITSMPDPITGGVFYYMNGTQLPAISSAPIVHASTSGAGAGEAGTSSGGLHALEVPFDAASGGYALRYRPPLDQQSYR